MKKAKMSTFNFVNFFRLEIFKIFNKAIGKTKGL